MTPAPLTGAHPDEGVLLRLLDGEADAETTAADEHAETCAACRGRLALLRRRADGLAALLAASDFPVPASAPPSIGFASAPSTASPDDADDDAKVIPLRRPSTPAPASRPWLRAAAIILLVLGVGAVATPARAWIAALVAELLGGDPPSQPAPSPTTKSAPAPAPAAASSRVEFVPTGSAFTIDVAHPQAAGALTLVRAAGPSATAEVVAGTGEADLLVLPSGLRIGNAAQSTAEYRVSVPASIRRVTVRVGGGTTTVDASAIGAEGRRIEL